MNYISPTNSPATSHTTPIELPRSDAGDAQPKIPQANQNEKSPPRNLGLTLKVASGQNLKLSDPPLERSTEEMKDLEIKKELSALIANASSTFHVEITSDSLPQFKNTFKHGIHDFVPPGVTGKDLEKIEIAGREIENNIILIQRVLLDNILKGEVSDEECVKYAKDATRYFVREDILHAKAAKNLVQVQKLEEKLEQLNNEKNGSADEIIKEYVHRYMIDFIRSYARNSDFKVDKYYDVTLPKIEKLTGFLSKKYPDESIGYNK